MDHGVDEVNIIGIERPPRPVAPVAEPVFEVVGVRRRFVHASRRQFATAISALEDVHLRAGKGEFIALIGPSGCGKSTLLSIIAGLTTASEGEVRIFGEPVDKHRREVGFVFQRDAILPWRTAIQNIELPLKYRGENPRRAREKATEWLARMGLRKFADHYPHQLSGGMRKRVAIAATLVYEPALLLMDEPFSALDVQTRDLIENDVLRIWQESRRQTVVLVTHDLEEAIGMSDRIVVMTAAPGRILREYAVPLARPRDLMECKSDPEFRAIYRDIWDDLRVEVLKAARSQE